MGPLAVLEDDAGDDDRAIPHRSRAAELVGQLERIAARAEAALDAVEQTRHRADQLVERADGLVSRTERVIEGAGELVRQTEQVLSGTDQLLAGTGQVSKRADALVSEAGQVVAQHPAALTDRLIAPILDRLASTTSPAEVDAVILLIDTMPELVERMRKEILPILSTMTNVAPDVRELLETTKEFTEILGSVPGLGRLKKRVEEREQQHDEERAEIEASVERP